MPLNPSQEGNKDKDLKSKDTATSDISSLADEPATTNPSDINPKQSGKVILPTTNIANGSLNHEYPIIVPPGRNNLQPNLALKYNSQDTANDSMKD